VSTVSQIYNTVAGGTIGNWLAIVGVLSLIYWGWRIIAALQHRSGAPDRAAAPSVVSTVRISAQVDPAARAVAADDIAVIAAAAHAILGTHRVVHVAPSGSGEAWAIEGRWMQQTSHKPR
jgi:hypothetical protein